MEDKGEVLVAAIVSLLAAMGAGFSGVFVSMLLSELMFRMGILTDEGAAWSGISLGVPVGITCAIIAFLWSFRKIRAYSKPH